MSERRYGYSDDIESIVDMKDSPDGLGIELTTSDVVSRLNQLEVENEALMDAIADLYKQRMGKISTIKLETGLLAHDIYIALLTAEDESMSLSEVKEKYLPNRDIEDLRKKPETPFSDVPITPRKDE